MNSERLFIGPSIKSINFFEYGTPSESITSIAYACFPGSKWLAILVTTTICASNPYQFPTCFLFNLHYSSEHWFCIVQFRLDTFSDGEEIVNSLVIDEPWLNRHSLSDISKPFLLGKSSQLQWQFFTCSTSTREFDLVTPATVIGQYLWRGWESRFVLWIESTSHAHALKTKE